MKVVFFGTSKFAVPSLEKLVHSRHSVVAVCTQPDRKKGRFLKMAVPPVKETACEYNIPIFQETHLDKNFILKLKRLSADIFVVIAYGKILKREVLEIPKKYCVNIHASLLPLFRGAAPINWAITNGEERTGVTLIRMNEKMDEGDIISHLETAIKESDTSLTLGERLSHLGAGLLLNTLNKIEKKKEKFKKQPSGEVTYARKLTKRDGLIDWKLEAAEIHAKVRGTVPWPGAYTFFNRKMLKIWKTKVLDGDTAEPGYVLKAEGEEFYIGTGKGVLKIQELQPEAGKRMDTASFLRGHRITVGDSLGV